MEITAKLIGKLDPVTGTSSKGEWKKQGFIFETGGEYPKKVCIMNWNDKVAEAELKFGHEYTVSVNVESRDYDGKWYTDITMWKVAPVSVAAAPQQTNKDGFPF